MRVAIATESFLPQVNGVTNSVLRVCEHLVGAGHDVLVIAPGPGPTSFAGARIVRTPSVRTPGYSDFRLGCPWSAMASTLCGFDPDVVHLASPVALGAQAAHVAARLGVPIVAVYQTDLAGFATRYGAHRAERMIWRWLCRVHRLAGRTLAPSRQAVDDLRRHGVERVVRWARGIDVERFHPAHRSARLRHHLAPDGELIIGYVGRLAAEKQLELLARLDATPGVRLVLVGEGPQRRALQPLLPRARFLGFRSGTSLSEVFASLDVFVHPGAHETFCQSAQEALASGVPVVGAAAGGLLDLVTPGDNGALFIPGDGVSLRDQVLSVAADRERQSLHARASVVGRSWPTIGRELEGHYAAVRG